jgi:hypothetical protein
MIYSRIWIKIFCSSVNIYIYTHTHTHENMNKFFIELNFMKLKVPTSNLVKFGITRAKFGINRYQDSRNFTQKS